MKRKVPLKRKTSLRSSGAKQLAQSSGKRDSELSPRSGAEFPLQTSYLAREPGKQLSDAPRARKRRTARKRSSRSKLARCEVRRCTRIARIRTYCASHARARADRLFSLKVREVGACQMKTMTPCQGPLQCCHLISRRYSAVRWDSRNAVAGCARHHQWWTAHPLEWDLWCTARLGDLGWAELRRAALSDKVELAEVLASLESQA
jgi:hypothetical protein